MRGKVACPCGQCVVIGITPAHAGKSASSNEGLHRYQDHPRACGEKGKPLRILSILWGSPPRMRGKVSKCPVCGGRIGITPAHAGKSSFMNATRSLLRDHPRVCGEKSPAGLVNRQGLGSPPRMRGKALHDKE